MERVTVGCPRVLLKIEDFGSSSSTSAILSPIVWTNKTVFIQFRPFRRFVEREISSVMFVCLFVHPQGKRQLQQDGLHKT